jgi:hypothetical protein
MEKHGFVEYSFLANCILLGIWGNRSMANGEVLPEMAKRRDGNGLEGIYVGCWMYAENQRVDCTLEVTWLDKPVGETGPVPVGAGLKLYWDAGQGGTFEGRATLVAPDRLVGYYWWD